jgi:hypothetical protein
MFYTRQDGFFDKSSLDILSPLLLQFGFLKNGSSPEPSETLPQRGSLRNINH